MSGIFRPTPTQRGFFSRLAASTSLAALAGLTAPAAPPSGVAMQYIGGKTGIAAGSTSGTPITVSLTSGLTGGFGGALQADDLIVVGVSVGHQGRSPAPVVRAVDDTAYSVAGTAQNVTVDTQDIYLDVRYRKHDGTSNDNSVEIGNSGNAADGLAYAIQVWRGVDVATAMDVTPTTATGQNTGRPDPPSITPTSAGAIILVFGAGGAAAGANFTAIDLMGFQTVNSPDTNDATIGCGFAEWWSGAFDPAGWLGGSTNANNSWAAKTLALRPASPGFVKPVPLAVGQYQNGGGFTTSWTAAPINVPSGAELLVVFVGVLSPDNTAHPTGVTWNGSAMAQQASIGDAGSQCLQCYTIANPAAGANNIVVSFADTTDKLGFIQAIAFRNINTASPISTVVSDSDTTTAPSVAPTGVTNGYPLGACAYWRTASGPAITSNAGQMTLTRAVISGDWFAMVVDTEAPINGAQSLGWSLAGSSSQTDRIGLVIHPPA